MLKILQIVRDAVDTGGGKVALETSKHMMEKGHQVLIVTDSKLNVHDYNYVVTPFGERLKEWKPKSRLLRIVRHLLQIVMFCYFSNKIAEEKSREGWVVINHNIESTKGDIIVLHNVFQAEHLLDNRPSWLKNLRWFNPVFSIRMLKEHIVLKRFSGVVVAVSRQTLAEAIPYIKRTNMLYTINNGVNVDLFHPLIESDRFILREKNDITEKFILLFIGHEFERKGLIYAIESLRYLPNIVELWVIGGRGSSWELYHRDAIKWGVEHRVKFMGTIMDTKTYYQMSDVFILPSKYETWALVGLEAMACSTPALMTRVGGIPEYLKDNENGYFIDGDAKNIAEKVNILINDNTINERMRKNSRDTALKFSWEYSAKKYLDLVELVKKESN